MIDAAIVERFQRDGAVCIRQLFRPAELAVLRAGIDENLAHLSPRAKVASTADANPPWNSWPDRTSDPG